MTMLEVLQSRRIYVNENRLKIQTYFLIFFCRVPASLSKEFSRTKCFSFRLCKNAVQEVRFKHSH